MIEDFSIEVAEVSGFPIQTFKHRFKNVGEMFCRAASVYREKVFLVEGSNRLTYGETENKAAVMAATLRERAGVGRGDHVGLLMENSIFFVITFWAIQKLGAVAVIFNTRLASAELARQFQFSDLKVLLTSLKLSLKVQEIPPGSFSVPQIAIGPSWEAEFTGQLPEITPEEIQEDEVALILFTSGTLGLPKGVMITHRNLITSALKQGYIFSQIQGLPTQEASKTVIAAPLFHVLALQEQLMASVFMGRGCVLVSSYQPQEIVNLFMRERVNILAMTPTMYWMLLHKTPIRDAGLDCVKLMVYGGAPMPPDLLRELRQTFPGVKCINGYGLTEASVISVLNDEFCELRPTSVGQPALCSEVKIVGPSGKELGANAVGELAVRGALVTKGYYRMPEETAGVYREGWFYTGDMAYRDADGFLYLVGRTREMINRGGENVYPVEVENILHLHPRILDVAVFGIPDPVLGEAVGCAIILRPGMQALGREEIQEFCETQLADYKIPQKIFLVTDLPRNPGGKVIKKKLLEQALGTGGGEGRERR
ncbi:MAG TPA: class I adenylate-forming enzyme family protein [Thermodesulfobacteriota bacterium]|nr:class I adenylate-forming enzyme family protein [Thermodesulfobacteriota bacterium]